MITRDCSLCDGRGCGRCKWTGAAPLTSTELQEILDMRLRIERIARHATYPIPSCITEVFSTVYTRCRMVMRDPSRSVKYCDEWYGITNEPHMQRSVEKYNATAKHARYWIEFA